MRYLAESNKKIGDSANNFRITRGIGQKSRDSAGYPIFYMCSGNLMKIQSVIRISALTRCVI